MYLCVMLFFLEASSEWIRILKISQFSLETFLLRYTNITFYHSCFAGACESFHSRNPLPSERRHLLGTGADRLTVLSLVRTSIF